MEMGDIALLNGWESVSLKAVTNNDQTGRSIDRKLSTNFTG
jgi:hypothetical protein